MSSKPKNEGLIDSVNVIIEDAKKRGIIHLYTDDYALSGRRISINNQHLLNFGSCSYLGLELDSRLKQGAIDAVNRFGTQYSSSRTYVSCGLYAQLEERLKEIFGPFVILSTSSSMAHQSVMPIVIGGHDALIYDQQAHVSMQELSYKLQHNGTTSTMIRHSRLDLLEEKIKDLSVDRDKVWYAIDGIYSMYGDYAPIQQLYDLLKRYKKFHLYIDDAHGMSWIGPNGAGYIRSQVEQHERVILCTSLAKGFGSAGGVTVFPNEEMYTRVKNWGGPLTYSGPQQPGTLGASIASADIHLSGEIYDLQEGLQQRVQYCQEQLKDHGLPIVSREISPVMFLGLGLPKVAYSMIQKMMDNGFYTNLGVFPAVPEACTGMRFTINNHLEKRDIDEFIKSIAYHLPKSMNEEGRTAKDLKRAFKKVADVDTWDDQAIDGKSSVVQNELVLEIHDTIEEINKAKWNSLFMHKGLFHYEGLRNLEQVFSGNREAENNWEFRYLFVKDRRDRIIAASFFTICILKDDMLSPAEVSRIVEHERKEKNNPYHLTSKAIMMGTPLSDGDHLFVDKSHGLFKKAISAMFKALGTIQEQENASMLFIRDFHADDQDMAGICLEEGLVKVDMPAQNHLDLFSLNSSDDLVARLKSKRRQQLKRDVLNFKDEFIVMTKNELDFTPNLLFEMYMNVKKDNLGLNTFDLPYKLFEDISKSNLWDVVFILHKGHVCSFIAAAKSGPIYIPVIIGMDKGVNAPELYKQTLYRTIIRALDMKFEAINLGMTAEQAKRGFGALQTKRVGYIQLKDHFNMNYLSLITTRTRLNALKKKGLNPVQPHEAEEAKTENKRVVRR